MRVVFTGHRPDKLGTASDAVAKALRSLLVELDPFGAISGMALGFDQLAAAVCLDLEIPLVAAVPFESQDALWSSNSRHIYRSMLDHCARVVVVSPGGYQARKMQRRNIWMVDQLESGTGTRPDVLVSCWNGSEGGTANCVRYAMERRRDVGFRWFNCDLTGREMRFMEMDAAMSEMTSDVGTTR